MQIFTAARLMLTWFGFLLVRPGSCTPINVGVLQTAFSTWTNIVKMYGNRNGTTSMIKSIPLNDSEHTTLNDLEIVLGDVSSKNVVSILGSYSKIYATVCEHLRIPYFITSPVPLTALPSPFHVRMIPDIRMYTLAIRDLFQHYGWKSAGLVYNTAHGSAIAALMMEHIHGRRDIYDIRTYDFRHNASADVIRWALKDLRRKLVTNFLVLCSPNVTEVVLTQALYLSLLSRPNGWLVINLGSGDIALSQFIDSRANLTLVRLMVDPQSPDCALSDSDVSLTNAVFYDVFNIINGTRITDMNNTRISRFDIRQQVKTQTDNIGCTGVLHMTKEGKRNETYLQMIALDGLVEGASGTWHSQGASQSDRVKPSQTYSALLTKNNDIFADKILRVTTLIEPPFIQWKNKTPEEGERMGNEKFEGFCIDILEEIAKMLKFRYNISQVPDGKFGSWKPPPRGWTGIIRQLLDNEADIGLAPFSITPERSEVVDFTKPFMTKGTSVVVRKPERSVWPFQFLSPLSKLVWIAIFVSFLFIGMFLFGVTRITNEEKINPMIDLRDSIWYVWGTLLRADLTGSPTSTSGRIISASWWFFSLIIISIYTANLAAFLTISNAHIPISSAADLAGQNEYNYGTVEGGQIESFFNHTKISNYQQMRAYMMIYNPSSKVRRVEQGFQRAMTEKYAFIWDSPTVRHETANNCDLMEIGSPFDLKGYGIASQKDSLYSEKLSMAVLSLNDNGILYRLEGKWWRRPNCPDPRSNAKSKEIEIEVASGMFIVLLCGIALSAIVCVIQYIAQKRCMRCRDLFEPVPTSDLQSNHNHTTTPFEDRIDHTAIVLSRTLSIGENNAMSNKWENISACPNAFVK
ncbi:glutamate receptor ionotropic, kainate 2-like isoform X2 [Dreissena polymorpha]|uniref:glutamate receptor ionotropic, kainate 2-like isoform X2 n=1 Tax=Dreissena polymorpha TaxID=45954 RepID=UPI002264B4EF|nr:glutamate receptor ionotropic, kainate 2-like isoform X2 [Dreissena polymorpha]